MDRQTIFETPGASLYIHPAAGIVHHEIHRPIHGEEVRTLFLRGLEVLKQHRATKWLSDDRKNAPLSRDDGLWIQENFLMAALEAGWRCWAMVQPESPEGQRNIRVYTDWGAPLGLEVKLFSDPTEALAWLVSARGVGGDRRRTS
jgi:hypothetical protein